MLNRAVLTKEPSSQDPFVYQRPSSCKALSLPTSVLLLYSGWYFQCSCKPLSLSTSTCCDGEGATCFRIRERNGGRCSGARLRENQVHLLFRGSNFPALMLVMQSRDQCLAASRQGNPASLSSAALKAAAPPVAKRSQCLFVVEACAANRLWELMSIQSTFIVWFSIL